MNMSTTTKPILVAGATGRHGGTGASVARLLRHEGLPVRALVRKADERAASLEALGAEIVIGDLHDRRSLKAALAGVEIAYFTYPIAAGVVAAAANLASAGRGAGLKRVVVMSMGASHPESPSHLGRAQWLAEELLEWAGFSCLYLRIAAFFFENLELLHRADIEGEGVIRNSFSDVATSWIAGEDAAKLAVAALLHAERFGAKTAVYPSGGYQYTHAEIAQILGGHLGRTLRHETISREAWQKRLLALSAHDDRITADMADHISVLGATIRQPLPTNDIFETVTQGKPVSLLEALKSGRLSFGTRTA
jgi:uncharacterized protein YbjT (DUF2867 family)